MLSDDGRFALIFNGEIYNYQRTAAQTILGFGLTLNDFSRV